MSLCEFQLLARLYVCSTRQSALTGEPKDSNKITPSAGSVRARSSPPSWRVFNKWLRKSITFSSLFSPPTFFFDLIPFALLSLFKCRRPNVPSNSLNRLTAALLLLWREFLLLWLVYGSRYKKVVNRVPRYKNPFLTTYNLIFHL